MERKHKLKELFDKRHVFEEYNNNIPQELNSQIQQADRDLIDTLHDLQIREFGWTINEV